MPACVSYSDVLIDCNAMAFVAAMLEWQRWQSFSKTNLDWPHHSYESAPYVVLSHWQMWISEFQHCGMLVERLNLPLKRPASNSWIDFSKADRNFRFSAVAFSSFLLDMWLRKTIIQNLKKQQRHSDSQAVIAFGIIECRLSKIQQRHFHRFCSTWDYTNRDISLQCKRTPGRAAIWIKNKQNQLETLRRQSTLTTWWLHPSS